MFKRFSYCRWRRLGLLALLLLPATGLGASGLPELKFGSGLIDRLVAQETRLDALREIVLTLDETKGKSDWKERSLDTFANYHQDIRLTRCPQSGDESPLYLLTYQLNINAISSRRTLELRRHELLYPETSRERDAINRLMGSRSSGAKKAVEPGVFWEPPAEPMEERALIFLDRDGQMFWPFAGNDLIDGGILHDVNGDGILERIEPVNMGIYDFRKGEPKIRVQLLEVHAVEMPARPLLRVVLNWHHREVDQTLRWNWVLRDMNSDGVEEIVIGPPTEDGIEVKAIFRWDAKTGRYTGPPGSRHEHFIMLDLGSDRWEQLKAIKAAGGMTYAPVPSVPRKQAFFEREPYVHKSLAGLSHTELFDFMWGGKEEHPSPPPPAGVRPRTGEERRRKFEVPEKLSQLEPQAAALSLARANRTDQHRADFELFMLDDASPPEIKWVIATQGSTTGLGGLRLDASRAPWWRTRFNDPPPTTLYPFGAFRQKWRQGDLSPERATWLGETLWWLTRLRSAPKTPEALHLKNELVRKDGFFGPPPTEFGFQVLDRDAQAWLDYPTGLPLRRCWQWVGPYDRQVCRTLAFALWRDVLGDFKKSGREASPSEALRFFTEASRQPFPDDVPARLLAEAVAAVGNTADAEALTRLNAIAREMPPPGERELAWRAAKARWDKIRPWTEETSWKEWRVRKNAFESASSKLTGNLAWHLRERLPRAMKQIRLTEDDPALADYASRPGTDLAIWALRQLEEQKPEAAVAALEAVYFRGPSKWRERILNYRARSDLDAAKSLYLALPADERVPLMKDFFRNVSDKAEGDEWIDPLLEVIESSEVPYRTRGVCLELLVPRHKPLKYPDRKIAERLETILKAELKRKPTEKNTPLLPGLLRALALRNQTEDIFSYADTILTRSEEDRFESSEFYTLVHVAQMGLTARERERMWAYFDPARSDVRAKRANYVGYVYMADIRQAHNVIARLATREPNEAEPHDYGSLPLIENGREHLARQLIAVWDEPDPATRVQCLIVFGMQIGSVWFTNSYPGPVDIALEEIRESLEKMSSSERIRVAEFLTFLESDPTIQERFENNHYAKHFLYEARKVVAHFGISRTLPRLPRSAHWN